MQNTAPQLSLKDSVSFKPSNISERIASIDALRGFDMFWLIGASELCRSFQAISDNPITAYIALQFSHTRGVGFHFFDFISPLFLFIVGLVIPVSISRAKASGRSIPQIYFHIFKRAAVLFILGMIANKLLYTGYVRFDGVLQRIAVSYLIASILVLHTSWRFQLAFMFLTCIAQYLTIAIVPPQSGLLISNEVMTSLTQPYRLFLWVLMVDSVLAGCLAGLWITSPRPQTEKAKKLLFAGLLTTAMALALSLAFPIMMRFWTASYMLLAAGLSMLLLALFYWIIDVKGYRRWSWFLVVIGSNAILIYFLSVTEALRQLGEFFTRALATHSGVFEKFVLAASFLLVNWLVCAFLYKHKIFFKA